MAPGSLFLAPCSLCDDRGSTGGGAAIKLYNDQTGEELGEVSDDDVQFLIDQLEEEDAADTSYYINQDTITMLRADGASQELLVLLEKAVAGSGDADVRWSE
ncbi:MAG TPA: galactosyldiacylglycerol synthase [Dehalococcoidia bacterium]